MKKSSIITLTLLLLTLIASAQKTKEFGLTYTHSDNFGLCYKAGSEKGVIKISLLSLSASYSKNIAQQSSLGIGLGGGYEFRKFLAKDFALTYGPELEFDGWLSHADNKPEYDNSGGSFAIKLGGNFGFRHMISKKISLSAEVFTAFSHLHLDSKDNLTGTHHWSNHFGFSMDNNSAALTLAYVLGK